VETRVPDLAGIVIVAALAALGWRLWYDTWLRQRALDRLRLAEAGAAPDARDAQAGVAFPPRYRALPAAVAVGCGLVVDRLGAPAVYAVALAAMTGAAGVLLEAFVAQRRVLRIEQQLADAIDLLVGALRAGAALLAAFEASLGETERPLREYLDEVVGRIRLGDAPGEAMRDLADRVPLETFRLFALTLAVHWEAGGSLATTLSTVGRTIRDRIELSRRVAAQSVEAKASSLGVLGITYAIAYLSWRTNPGPFMAFAVSGIGSSLLGFAIVLQAVGLLWMDRISRSRF
jgi:Flp pilus assembly protein TadB